MPKGKGEIMHNKVIGALKALDKAIAHFNHLQMLYAENLERLRISSLDFTYIRDEFSTIDNPDLEQICKQRLQARFNNDALSIIERMLEVIDFITMLEVYVALIEDFRIERL